MVDLESRMAQPQMVEVWQLVAVLSYLLLFVLVWQWMVELWLGVVLS